MIVLSFARSRFPPDITATTRRDADRQRREQERYTKGNAASAEIGKATYLVDSARRLGAAQHAKTVFDQAANALNAATSAFSKEAFDDATRSAAQALGYAEEARTTTTTKLEQIKVQRKKEERDALVKDTLLRVQRNKESLDDFARQVSAKQLESVDGLVRLAEKLVQEDKAELALVNAERADALVQQAVQYAKDAKTTRRTRKRIQTNVLAVLLRPSRNLRALRVRMSVFALTARKTLI